MENVANINKNSSKFNFYGRARRLALIQWIIFVVMAISMIVFISLVTGRTKPIPPVFNMHSEYSLSILKAFGSFTAICGVIPIKGLFFIAEPPCLNYTIVWRKVKL